MVVQVVVVEVMLQEIQVELQLAVKVIMVVMVVLMELLGLTVVAVVELVQ
jgi:hypothetical protein